MTTQIWRVDFSDGFKQIDVVARTVAQAVNMATRMFKEETLLKKSALDARIKTTRQLWRYYRRNGYAKVTTVELLAESDN